MRRLEEGVIAARLRPAVRLLHAGISRKGEPARRSGCVSRRWRTARRRDTSTPLATPRSAGCGATNPWFFSNTFNQRVPGLNSLAHGVLAAIDSRTNKVVWKKNSGRRPSGAMTTAGGLMFQSAPDGNVQAYHARTGNMLWQFRLAQPVDRRCHTRLTASMHRRDRSGRRVGIQAGRDRCAGVRSRPPTAGAFPGAVRTRRRLKRLRSFAIPGLPVSTT